MKQNEEVVPYRIFFVPNFVQMNELHEMFVFFMKQKDQFFGINLFDCEMTVGTKTRVCHNDSAQQIKDVSAIRAFTYIHRRTCLS